MLRSITGFRLDEKGDWTALLDCGHPQHVRHNPPFTNRPWVTTESGRRSKLGAELNCVRCDRRELPDHFVACRRTPVYTEADMPAAPGRMQATAAGIWEMIVVEDGMLRCRLDESGGETTLTPAAPGIVPPQVRHRLEAVAGVRFYLEYFCAPGAAGPQG